MKTIIYIGNFGFPDKNASGKRVLANCLCFQKIGYRTVCIGPDSGVVEKEFDVTLYSIQYGNSIKRVINNEIRRVIEILENERFENDVRAVILYGALFTQKENIKIIKWCKERFIKVIYDQVDWFELNWHNPFRAIIRAGNQYLMNKKVIPSCEGVICISKFLEEFHRNNGFNTIVIPPLAIINSSKLPTYMDEKTQVVRFAYAGTSTDIHRPVEQWKDRIDLFFQMMADCLDDSTLRPFLIDIYGLTLEQYINMFPKKQGKDAYKIIERLGECIHFHGKVDNKVAVEGIRNANFTFLIREKKRSTMAGFPTKISESISCGTPVICNDTSDLKNYIINEKNGFIFQLSEMRDNIKKILKMSNQELYEMKLGCANNPFYYEKFVNTIEKWLKDIGI